MWFFMYACYILSLLTFALLCTAFTQSFLHFYVLKANHITFMVLTSIIYFFTETLVIFFFVGTGVSVKEYTLAHNLDSVYHKRSIGIKRRVYPPLLLNMLFMIILFILPGAVDTRGVPAWVYQFFFFCALIHLIYVKIVQNACFRDNTQIILEMTGTKKA